MPAKHRLVRVRTRKADPADAEGDAVKAVKSWWTRPLSEYRRRRVTPSAPLIVQFPLFFAELREIKRTKVYKRNR